MSIETMLGAKRRTTEEIEIEISSIMASVSTSTAKRIANTPPRYRLAYAKSLAAPIAGQKKSLSKAVKQKCYECVGFEDVRDRVGHCTCRTCPLWHHRPYRDKQ